MVKRREEAAARLRARVGDYLAAQLELHKYPDEGFDQLFSDTDILPASVRRWRDYLHRAKNSSDPIFSAWIALASLPADEFEIKAETALESVRKSNALNPLIAAEFATAPKTLREAADR